MADSDCVIIFPWGQSKYSGSSADRSLNYLERHNDRDFCYDMSGRPLAGVERQALVDYADDYGFRRMGTLSLRWGNEISDRDYRRHARKFFSEFARDRPSVRVAYSVHRNTRHHHLQFVITGDREDCMTDKRELEHLRERGRKIFRVRERERFHSFKRGLFRFGRKLDRMFSGFSRAGGEKYRSRFSYLFHSILTQSKQDLNRAIERVNLLEKRKLLDKKLCKKLREAFKSCYERERERELVLGNRWY